MTENTTDQNTTAGNNQPSFSMQKVYVRDLSFEAPGVPESFNFEGGYKPNINLELNSSNREIQEGIYEVTLHITVTAKQDEKTLFLAEVKQSGVFSVANMDDANKRNTLGSFCPSILFPYARQQISDMVSNGGFPQLLLAHINFEQLYQASEERKRAEMAAAAETAEATPESSH